jgi:hypothetical protein
VNRRRIAIVAAALIAAAAVVWILVATASRWSGGSAAPAAVAAPAAAPADPERRIKATLYYVSEDGLSMPGVQREIPFGESIGEQARRIVEAQLAAAPAPYVSPLPAGTSLRSVFIGERGDAFVDLSGQVRTGHPGGSLTELFTTNAVVNALKVKQPANTRVQILIDGKEVYKLAGHLDLRHPLQKNLTWTALQTDTDK